MSKKDEIQEKIKVLTAVVEANNGVLSPEGIRASDEANKKITELIKQL